MSLLALFLRYMYANISHDMKSEKNRKFARRKMFKRRKSTDVVSKIM